MIFGPQFIHISLIPDGGGNTGVYSLAPTAGNELGNYTAHPDYVNFASTQDFRAIYNDPITGRLWRTNGSSGNMWTSTDGGNTWSEEPFAGVSYPLSPAPTLKHTNALNIEDLTIYDINNDGQDELVWSDPNRSLYYTSYPITTANVTSITVERSSPYGGFVSLGWTFKLNDNWYSIKTGGGTNGNTGLWRNTDYKNDPNNWTHVIDYAASQGGSFPAEISANATRHGGVASTSGTIILNLIPGSPYDNIYFRSTDDGATWTLLGSITGTTTNFDLKRIATDNNDNWVLAGSGNKYYYSTNDGATWTQATPSYNPVGATNWVSNDVLYLNGKWLMIRENDSVGSNDPSELISTSTPWVSNSWVLEENNFFITFDNGGIGIETRLNGMKPAGQNLILTSGESGYFTYYKIPININVLNTSSNQVFMYAGWEDSNGTIIKVHSNEHTTPAESKRLKGLLTNITGGYGDEAVGPYIDTANLEVGTKLYGVSSHGNNSSYLYYTMNNMERALRNTYAHYIVTDYTANPGDPVDPSIGMAANTPVQSHQFYWVTVNTTTSTVEGIYADSQVATNTLKDVTCSFNSGGTVGVNGAFFIDGNGYGTYTNALNANISTGATGDILYCDAESKYPKVGDRTYQTVTSTTSDSSNQYQRSWVPFLLEGTTSSGSAQYAVKFDYASYNNTNTAGMTSPFSTNSYFITEIRDSSGNSVTEIPSNVPMGWFANAFDEYSGFSTRSNACSGGFANSTSIRVHFKSGNTIVYPTTTQDIIDGSLSGSGAALDMYNDNNGSLSTKFRGGALYVGLVYKPISNQNTSTQPQLTLIALGSSTDSPPYIAEGSYNSVQSCP